MFRTDPDHPFEGPHQNEQIFRAGEEFSDASVVMILIHGRGASAQGILTLADQIGETGVHYLAPQASNHIWYPYSFLEPVERNEPGLSSGLQVIRDLLAGLEKEGVSPERVILGGFSQGACLSSEYVARHPRRYGGVVALSGGLIGQQLQVFGYNGDLEATPVFLGCSDVDPHIPLERVEQTAQVFEKLGADVNKQIYPGMPHTVNQDEMVHVNQLIRDVKKVNS